MKKILLLFLIIYSITIQAQIIESSQKEKPNWFSEIPESPNYKYYIGFGEQNSLENAKNKALNDVFEKISHEIGITEIKVSSSSNTQIQNEQNESNIETKNKFEFTGKVETTGETIQITGLREVENYWQRVNENGTINYKYWVLIRKSKNKIDSELPLYVSYGIAPIWRSSLIPGWGQMYKKEKNKAAIYLGTEVVLLGTTIYTWEKAENYIKKANQSFDYETKKYYINKSNDWKTYRAVFGVGTIAVWIINIIDAATANNKRFAINSTNKINMFLSYNQIGVKFNIN